MPKLLCTSNLRVGHIVYIEGGVSELTIEEAMYMLQMYPNTFIPYDKDGELALDYVTGRKIPPVENGNSFGASGGLETMKNPGEE